MGRLIQVLGFFMNKSEIAIYKQCNRQSRFVKQEVETRAQCEGFHNEHLGATNRV